MQEDFHYYATYCAAYMAGYSHEESTDIAYSAQFVDHCTVLFLNKVKGPRSAATTQLQSELLDANTDFLGLQNITRIWSSFHFLPGDLYVKIKGRPKIYMDKYRLICNPDGELAAETVKLAAKHKDCLQGIGIAMHVIADTWAHRYFAGTPSLVINNTNYHFYELLKDDNREIERKIKFIHNPTIPDDFNTSTYTNSLFQASETSIMNLGHGRAGHLPDYSFIRYKYLPAWGNYREIIKDNPSDYYKAFCQLVYALRYIRGDFEDFKTGFYDTETVAPYSETIKKMLQIVTDNNCDAWKEFGEKLSGKEIETFNISKHEVPYTKAGKREKDDTYLGKFFNAAIAQKSMVTNSIFKSKNLLAGFAIEKSLIDLRNGSS